MLELIKMVFEGHISRGITCGVLGYLAYEHVKNSAQINAEFASALLIFAMICGVVVIVSMLLYMLEERQLEVIPLIAVALCVVTMFNAYGIYKTASGPEGRTAPVYSTISFTGGYTKNCTQCVDGACRTCGGQKIAKYGNVLMRCLGCSGTGVCKICKGSGLR